jgi:hypothetical protein
MFRFTKKPSLVSHSQYLAEITSSFRVDIDVARKFSVLWWHSMTCVACVLCTVQAYTLTQCRAHIDARL